MPFLKLSGIDCANRAEVVMRRPELADAQLFYVKKPDSSEKCLMAAGGLRIKPRNFKQIDGYSTLLMDLYDLDHTMLGVYKNLKIISNRLDDSPKTVIDCQIPKTFKLRLNKRGLTKMPAYRLMPLSVIRCPEDPKKDFNFKTQIFYVDHQANVTKMAFLFGQKQTKISAEEFV